MAATVIKLTFPYGHWTPTVYLLNLPVLPINKLSRRPDLLSPPGCPPMPLTGLPSLQPVSTTDQRDVLILYSRGRPCIVLLEPSLLQFRGVCPGPPTVSPPTSALF